MASRATTKEGRSRLTSNTEKAGATREDSLSEASDSPRRLSSGVAGEIGKRRHPVDGQPAAYVCRNRTYDAPVTSATTLLEHCAA